MGQFFSDNVEKALQYIYYENKGYARHGQEGFQLLTDASAAGDGDATCILARCLSGPQYVWKGFGFPEESDEKVEALYRLSVEQGSAGRHPQRRTERGSGAQGAHHPAGSL